MDTLRTNYIEHLQKMHEELEEHDAKNNLPFDYKEWMRKRGIIQENKEEPRIITPGDVFVAKVLKSREEKIQQEKIEELKTEKLKQFKQKLDEKEKRRVEEEKRVEDKKREE